MLMEDTEDDPPVVMFEEEQEVVHINVSLDVQNMSAAASTSAAVTPSESGAQSPSGFKIR